MLTKFISGIRFKFTLKVIPRSTNSSLPRSRFTETLSLSLEYFFLPIYVTFVFSLFILRPDKFPYISSGLSTACSECCEPSKIKVVSNWIILNSLEFILNSIISGFIRNKSAIISAPKRNRYGDKGSPCLQPWPTQISSDRYPLCSIYILISLLKSLTQFINFSWKPKKFRVLYKKSHKME